MIGRTNCQFDLFMSNKNNINVEIIELTIYANVFLLSVRYNVINMQGGLVWFIVLNATFKMVDNIYHQLEFA